MHAGLRIPDPAPRRGAGEEEVRDPDQPLEEIVGMPAVPPEARVADPARVPRATLEHRELGVGQGLAADGQEPEGGAGPLEGPQRWPGLSRPARKGMPRSTTERACIWKKPPSWRSREPNPCAAAGSGRPPRGASGRCVREGASRGAGSRRHHGRDRGPGAPASRTRTGRRAGRGPKRRTTRRCRRSRSCRSTGRGA
jgi:hypothetical protein